MKKALIPKAVALILLLCLFVINACGCFYLGYSGEYKGAYTVAYSSIPGTRGARFPGPGFNDPQILLLDEDSFGRGLYLYFEGTDDPLSVIILQKEDDKKAYFYPEDCFISFKLPDSVYDLYDKKLTEERLLSLVDELCSDETLADFKELNDWNKPMNEAKCDSAAIERQPINVTKNYRSGKLRLSMNTIEDHMKQIAIKNGHILPEEYLNDYSSFYAEANWMATDSYGRELYYVYGYYYVYSEEGVFPSTMTVMYLEMVAIVNPDGSTDPSTYMVELTDKLNCQDQLKKLKAENGWNTPLSDN